MRDIHKQYNEFMYEEFPVKQDQRSQEKTPREPKGSKTRGIKVNAGTKKFKSKQKD